jgi:dissimilatory sulfite reductase (desulfoviridin) alpha/beta subunit
MATTVIIASENLAKKAQAVKENLEMALNNHLRSAAARDLNPWVRAYNGEIVSKLEVLHPDIGRLASREIAFQNDGWLSADGLLLLAELSESRGAGLIELSGPEKTAKLLALSHDDKGLPWKGLLRSGLFQPGSQSTPSCCPFWGPCLGHKTFLAEAIFELAVELEQRIGETFRVELAGCPLDCRIATATADLAIILDSEALNFVIWLGGRHRPFRKEILPKPWLKQSVSNIKELLEMVFQVYDAWSSLTMDQETLPELVARVGLERFEERISKV